MATDVSDMTTEELTRTVLLLKSAYYAADAALGYRRAMKSIFCIYSNPRDYPGKFVVRRWMVGGGRSAPDAEPMIVCDSLEEARKVIPPFKLRWPHMPGDDVAIVETWW